MAKPKPKRKNRAFSEDFKRKSVAEYERRRAVDPITKEAFARELGISAALLYTWMKKYGSDAQFHEAQEGLPPSHTNGLPHDVLPVGRRFRVTMVVDSVDDVFAQFGGVAHSIEVVTEHLLAKKNRRRLKTEPQPLLALPAPILPTRKHGLTRQEVFDTLKNAGRAMTRKEIAAIVKVDGSAIARYLTEFRKAGQAKFSAETNMWEIV